MTISGTRARVHYDALLQEARETRQKLLLSVRRQYEYLELPMPAAIESWGIPALQERLTENADLIWKTQGKPLLEAVREAHQHN